MDKSEDLSYSLLSLHPINKKNGPGTELEREGLEFVVDNPGEHFYGEEELGGEDYFTAVYANYAVAEACATMTTRIPHAATSRSAADQAGRKVGREAGTGRKSEMALHPAYFSRKPHARL